MDAPRLLTNSTQTDRLLRTKLSILKKTLRVRGVEVYIIKSTNEVFSKVHGFNDIDLDGDRDDETTVSTERVVLNLNDLTRVGEKGSASQTIYHIKDIADEGDIIKYRSRVYEYAFKVTRKSTYGELDHLYEYELEHFRTIERSNYQEPKVVYESKDIDQLFTDHTSDYKTPEKQSPTDWRDRIDNLDNI